MTCWATGADGLPPVASLPRLPPFPLRTATAILGASAGANEMNQPWGGCPVALSAVPVLPATLTPRIWAAAPVPESTTPSISVGSVAATSGEIAEGRRGGGGGAGWARNAWKDWVSAGVSSPPQTSLPKFLMGLLVWAGRNCPAGA